MEYKNGTAFYDIVVPPDLKPGQVIWVQPVVTNGASQKRWSAALTYTPSAPLPPVEKVAATLTLKPTWGARPLTVVSNAIITVAKPGRKAETESVRMTAELTESMTSADKNSVALRMRYNKFSVSYPKTMFSDEKRQELQKALNQIRMLHANLIVDNLNNLKKNEVDPGPLVKAPKETKQIMAFLNGQVQDSLEMLWIPLPGRQMQPGETWKATRPLLVPIDLPGDIPMELTFTYLGVRERDGRPHGVITILGVSKDKLGKYPMTGNVKGFAYLDLTTNQISFANVTSKLELNAGDQGKFTATQESKLERMIGKDVLVVRDQLTDKEPVDARKCPYKVHTVQLEGGKPCVISLESFKGPGYFDTLVRVEDMNNQKLVEDDDHGVDLNSLLVFTPPVTGQYRIVATCYQPAMGNYMLVVRQ
jgi:hypothetical protein